MTWFVIPRSWHRDCCATEGCFNVSEYRLESDGSGADYCVNCKAKIEEKEK